MKKNKKVTPNYHMAVFKQSFVSQLGKTIGTVAGATISLVAFCVAGEILGKRMDRKKASRK